METGLKFAKIGEEMGSKHKHVGWFGKNGNPLHFKLDGKR